MTDKPLIIAEEESWLVVYKPHNMPSAPLRETESGTLVNWVIRDYPQALAVRGKKYCEYGLVHRLDTGTSGLVLFALDQATFDYFQEIQNRDLLEKQYRAMCLYIPDEPTVWDCECLSRGEPSLPSSISSVFRSWGPGGKMVKPLFRGERGFDSAGKEYTTRVLSCTRQENGMYECRCSLTRGFRHQIRSHLARWGFPLAGDALYNPVHSGTDPLQLFAETISFPDMKTRQVRTFSLPKPDKTNP